MNRCRQCNVTISDNTNICPLCHCVVDKADDGGSHCGPVMRVRENEYPDVWLAERKVKLACNIGLFAILLVSATLAGLNYAFYAGSLWSVLPIAAMAYAYTVFRLVAVSRRGYRSKILISLLLAVLLVLLIDAETGFAKWSLNFVLPGSILLVDLVILILMLVNLKNWQSYIIMQIGILAFCLIPMLLWILQIITNPVLSIIALGVTLFLFLGTVIVGDRTARAELHRRFHIR